MIIEPYLFFEGRCEEAVEFYRTALGAEIIMLMRYKDSPVPVECEPGSENKVLHASLRIGDSTVMVSDGMCKGPANFEGFSLSITVASEAETRRLFEALADGGHVVMPLTKTFYSPLFGMTKDRFGVLWMIMADQPKPA